MRNSIMLFIATTFMVGTILTGCQTSTEKVNDAKDDVTEANQDLREVKAEASADAQKEANETAWREYKTEVEAKIDANDAMIEDSKDRMKKTGKTMTAVYKQQIEALEERNKTLRQRINDYNVSSQADWESFKREFNRDMDELGKSMNDFTVNNQN